MGLYHFRKIDSQAILLACFTWLVIGCVSPQATQALITVTLTVDQQTTPFQLPAGSTVQKALDTAGITLNSLDRSDPPVYTVLTEGTEIHIIRVTEEFEIKQEVIPYKHQILKNESLPKDQEILIQKGMNGLKEITYRKVFEDGVEISSQPVPVKSVIVEEPKPEIRMIGIQSPFSPINVPGRLLYIRDGNLWIIEGTTSNRRALITTGDLDGRIFSLSSDGSWLLFSRHIESEGEEDQINSLWVTNIDSDTIGDAGENTSGLELVELGVANVIQFADWVPGSITKIVFSTVEPRSAAPGWQANNDLISLTFSTTGWTTKGTIILEPNSGGVYGWWGTEFLWGPNGENLAFARPDGVGVVDLEASTVTPLLEIVPLLTRADWAWVPGITWGPDGHVLYYVDHIYPAGSTSREESPYFNLGALTLGTSTSLHLVSQTGMFAYPLASPLQIQSSGQSGYQIAFLQAIFPDQSDTSRYRLAVMDRDGSNRRSLFPPEEAAGLEPLRNWGAWSPAPLSESGNYALAVLVEGNLWIVDTSNGTAVQITGDGLTNRVIWVESPTL